MRRLLLRNKRLKMLSLILAVLAWYGIHGTVGTMDIGRGVPAVDTGSDVRKLAGLPVLAIVRPDPAVNVELAPARVSVVLTGTSSELQKLTRADIRVMVDCGGVRSSASYDLPVVVSVPQWAAVAAEAQPAAVRVTLTPAR